jgi:hypothetical protein
MKSGKSDTSINAPTDIKNKAANISLIGVASTLETACDFDSAINTPAKKHLLNLRNGIEQWMNQQNQFLEMLPDF